MKNRLQQAIDLCNTGQVQDAFDLNLQILQDDPNNAAAHNNHGVYLRRLKQPELAISSFEKALELNPQYESAHNNLGTIYLDVFEYEKALNHFNESIRLKPTHAQAHLNRGIAFKHLQRFDEALESMNEALALEPNYFEAQWDKALVLLLKGEFLSGWRLYESRKLKLDSKKFFSDSKWPSWNGENLFQKTIFVNTEQGFGDVIQFCRYLLLLKAQGARVILGVRAPLASLLATFDSEISVTDSANKLSNIDYFCTLLSLPYLLKTTLTTIPSWQRYLHADAQKVAIWQERLGPAKKPRVGLVWSGSTAHKDDLLRSIPFKKLEALFDGSVEWHSLQKEYRAADRERPSFASLTQHHEMLSDFSDTAALVECMDLVITVDTSVAHLAGALGKPVWVLLPLIPDFRWLLDRTDSPWYPSARLYRQKKFQDWEGVIQEVGEDLLKWDYKI
jgi:tetratricopeptide (TPR) repeat protein